MKYVKLKRSDLLHLSGDAFSDFQKVCANCEVIYVFLIYMLFCLMWSGVVSPNMPYWLMHCTRTATLLCWM